MSEKIIEYFNSNSSDFIGMVLSHLKISFLSLMIAAAIGVGFGYFAVVHKKSEKMVLGFFQILRIIPSLAVLLFLIPIMGTGMMPSLTALVLLGIPPILLNTVTGFEQIPDFMIETAQGQGMNDSQIMRKVKWPLAMPFIFSGIKIGMVEIIASATLAAKIGGGGLGELIFTGLGLSRTDLIFIGGVSVAVLSLLANLAAEVIDHTILKYKYER